ncbi:MAG: hypothetical protein RR382_00425 [Tannerellaceae bacterium]
MINYNSLTGTQFLLGRMQEKQAAPIAAAGKAVKPLGRLAKLLKKTRGARKAIGQFTQNPYVGATLGGATLGGIGAGVAYNNIKTNRIAERNMAEAARQKMEGMSSAFKKMQAEQYLQDLHESVRDKALDGIPTGIDLPTGNGDANPLLAALGGKVGVQDNNPLYQHLMSSPEAVSVGDLATKLPGSTIETPEPTLMESITGKYNRAKDYAKSGINGINGLLHNGDGSVNWLNAGLGAAGLGAAGYGAYKLLKDDDDDKEKNASFNELISTNIAEDLEKCASAQDLNTINNFYGFN